MRSLLVFIVMLAGMIAIVFKYDVMVYDMQKKIDSCAAYRDADTGQFIAPQ